MACWMCRCFPEALAVLVVLGLLGCRDPIVILDVDGVPAGTRSLLLRTRLQGALGVEAWFSGDTRSLVAQLPRRADEQVTLELYAMLPGDCVTASGRLTVAIPGGLGGWARHAAVLERRRAPGCDVETVRGEGAGLGNLNGVWVSDTGGVFAAATSGEVTYCPAGLPCNAVKITQPPVPPYDFHAIWGSSDASVYLAGHSGTVARCQSDRTNFGCSLLESHTMQSLRANWGARDGRYYAVGGGSALVVCDVGSNHCRPREVGVSSSLNGVWGTEEERVFVVGDRGVLARCAPEGPCAQEDLATSRNLYAVWGRDAGHVYAVGSGGTVLRCTDRQGSCRLLTSNTRADLSSVWGTDADNVYAVGSQGTILRCSDGSDACAVLDSGTAQALLAVRASDAGNAYVAGESGTALRCSAGMDACAPLDVGGTNQPLRAVFGLDPDSVYFVGGAGTVLRRKLH